MGRLAESRRDQSSRGAGSGIGGVDRAAIWAGGRQRGGHGHRRRRGGSDGLACPGCRWHGPLQMPLDITVQPDVIAVVADAMARLGRIDVLVNNAGAGAAGDLLDTYSGYLVPGLLALEPLRGRSCVCRRALLCTLERGRGSIVNISSVNGLIGVGEEPYSAAKAGVINLTRNICIRHGPQGHPRQCHLPGHHPDAQLDRPHRGMHGHSRTGAELPRHPSRPLTGRAG